MKRILVPTDFSTIADNALNYAIEIADKFKSELHLYHVYRMRKNFDYDWDYPEDEQPYVKKLEQQMNITKERFSEKLEHKGLTVQTTVEEEHIFDLFKTKVSEHNINLIIMGSKGASGLTKVIFGSFAADALELSKVPVLVVPPTSTFHPLKRILLATDLNDVSTSILLPLQKLASKFDAEVTILNVNTDKSNETPLKNNLYLKDVKTTYCEIPVSKSINDSINDFVKENNFDLLCMVRREKGIIESIFKKSVTTAQVFNSKIPLLVLPDKGPAS